MISIRPLEFEDLKYRVDLLNDVDISNGLTIERPLSYSKTEKWYNNIILNEDKKHFVIEKNDSKRKIGIIGLVNLDYNNRKAEIYIAIGSTINHNKGFGSIALNKVLKYAFEYLDMNKIYLYTHIDNIIAKNFYEKNKFSLDGVLRKDRYHNGKIKDYYIFSILKEEWMMLNE